MRGAMIGGTPGGNRLLIGGNEEARREAWLRESGHKTETANRMDTHTHTQQVDLIYQHPHMQSFPSVYSSVT